MELINKLLILTTTLIAHVSIAQTTVTSKRALDFSKMNRFNVEKSDLSHSKTNGHQTSTSLSPKELAGKLSLDSLQNNKLIAGPDVTGGGDLLVMNFKIAGNKICKQLQTSEDRVQWKFSVDAFCEATENVRLQVEDRTFLTDGTEVDAINSPTRRYIKLSFERNKHKSLQQIMMLAAHEYISVIGVDDKDYSKSQPIADELSQAIGGQVHASSITNAGNALLIENPKVFTTDGLALPIFGLTEPQNSVLIGTSVCKYLGYQSGRVSDAELSQGKVVTFNIYQPGEVSGIQKAQSQLWTITQLTCVK